MTTKTRPPYKQLIEKTGFSRLSVWRTLTGQETTSISDSTRETILAAFVELGGNPADLPLRGYVWPARTDSDVTIAEVEKESRVAIDKVAAWFLAMSRVEEMSKKEEMQQWEDLKPVVSQAEQMEIRDAVVRLRGRLLTNKRLWWNSQQKFQQQRRSLEKKAAKQGYQVEHLERWLEHHHPMDAVALTDLGLALGYRGDDLDELVASAGEVVWSGELIKVFSMPGFRSTLEKLVAAVEDFSV